MPARSTLSPVIQRLAAIRPGPARVVSCYLRLEVEDRTRGRFQIALRDAVKQARAVVDGLPLPARRPLERDLNRIARLVEQPKRLPHTPGLAIFGCQPIGLFVVVPLPRVHQTRIVIGRTAQIRELMALEEEVGRLLVTVFDRARARFFEVTALEVTELSGLPAVSTRGGRYHSDREDSPGWGEHDFHNRIEEERHRHFAAIGARLAQLDRQAPARGFVLAGPLEETRSAAHFLPAKVADRLLGSARLNPTAVRAPAVQAAALRVRREHERQAEQALVGNLEQRVGARWATNGARDTLRALSRGQIRTLLIRADLTGFGFRCADTGRLVLAKGDCRGEGEPEPVADLVNEAIEEALRQRAEVMVIHDRDSQQAIDGLAAILRFR